MRNENTLATIKTESIRAVYHILLSGGEITRADVAEQTGLSLMTTCKICDALIDCGFFRQEKDAQQKSGRKASLITVNPDRFCLLLTRTGESLSAELINMALELSDSITQPADDLQTALPFFLLTLFTEWADRLDAIDGIAFFIGQFPPETEDSIAQVFPNITIYPLNPVEAVRAALRNPSETMYYAPNELSLFYISKSNILPLHPEAFLTPDAPPSKVASTLGKLTGLFGTSQLILEHPPAALAAHFPHARIANSELTLPALGSAEIIRRNRLNDLLERVKPL